MIKGKNLVRVNRKRAWDYKMDTNGTLRNWYFTQIGIYLVLCI
jgi:hypothetical protein